MIKWNTSLCETGNVGCVALVSAYIGPVILNMIHR